MTGKELIIYILKHDLEDEPVIKDGVFLGLINEEQAAIKFGVGVATIKAWYQTKMLQGIKIGNSIFFAKNEVKK